MSASSTRSADATRPERFRRTARFAGAATLSAGVVAGVAGAAFGGADPLLDAALGLAAVGLVLSLYGLGSADSGPAVRLSRAGLGVATVAVVLAPLGSTGVELPVPGGPWGLLYVAGVTLLVIAETVIPSVGTVGADRSRQRAGTDQVDRGDTDLTVAIRRSEGGNWVWELRGPDGTGIASGPREYDTATAAHGGATRVAEVVGAEVAVVTDAADPARGGSPEREDVGGGGEDASRTDPPASGSDDPSLPPGEPDEPVSGPPEDAEGSTPGAEFVGAAGAERGVFELAETGEGWRWRLRFEGETVVAESARAFPGLDATRRAVDRVRTQAPGAGALTYDPGAFEVYREAPGAEEWSWRLRADDGSVIATAPGTFGSRGDGFAAVEALKGGVDGDPEVRAGEGHHRWVLAVDGDAIARSPHGFESGNAAREAFDRVRAVVPEAGVIGLDPAGFEVGSRSGGAWGWRLRHRDGRVVARGPAQATRDRAIEGLRTVQRVAPDAEVAIDERETGRIIEEALSDAAEARSMAEGLPSAAAADEEGETASRDPPASASDSDETAHRGVVAVVDRDGWEWELRRGGEVLARAGGVADRAVAADAASAVAAAMERATVLRVDPVAVEVYRDGGWRWRLVERSGEVLATGSAASDHARAARRAAETALAALSGDPEVYRDEGWRWRVRHDGAVVAESGRGFGSPGAAREAAAALPESVATAPVTECEAALEVFAADGSWRWRLRAADGRVVLGSDTVFPDADAAARAVHGVVGQPVRVVSDDGNAPDAEDEAGTEE
jgi:uncharacterized protein YegP (UPF0339 family)